MKLINILRYIKGYVKFTVSGGFRERFINLCNAEGVRIWNVVPEIGQIHAYVSINNFRRLRKIVRSSGVILKITEKKGFPLFLKKYRHRAVLMVGIFFIIAFYILMNRFIWFIEVNGTQTVSHEEIINVLSDYGVKIGAYAPDIDSISAGRYAINYFDGRLLWMSVNIKGSKAVIEVRDYVDNHEDTTYGKPCNIIADFDGTILSIETINGDKVVSPGSAVKSGDLLLSGVIQNRDMSASYLEARGKITAHHSQQFVRSYNKKAVSYKYTDVKEYSCLGIIGLKLPLRYYNDNMVFSYSEFLSLQDTRLPFGIIYEAEVTEYETEEAFSLLHAVDAYILDFYRTFPNTNILECKITVKASRRTYEISADMSCIDFMGVKSEILVEN